MSRIPVIAKFGIGLAALLVSFGVVFGVFQLFVLALSDPGPEPIPDHPVVVGVRADGDQLSISTGRICPAGTDLLLGFRAVTGGTPAYFNIVTSEPTNSIQVKNPLPTGVNWQDAGAFNISAQISGQETWGGAGHDLSGLAEESAKHSAEIFFFGDQGWLTAEEVAARDGKDLLTICTPRDR